MAESSFEGRLERMFADAPAMRDGELFAVRVLDRLDRGWNARRLLIGAMGAAGGVIGAVQVVGTGMLDHLQSMGAGANDYMNRHLADVIPSQVLPAGFALDGQVLWMSLALAVTAAGLGLARLIREI